jgi:PAS domain S-box-containing protein
VPYFKAGLENNEFCMWITSEPLGVKEAKAALGKAVKGLDDYISKGQIEILDYSEWYTKSGEFNADEVLHGWVEKEMKALEKGFTGLRATGNTSWLGAEDWVAFREYEAVIDSVIGEHRMITICAYSLDRCESSEMLDVMNNHEITLIKRTGLWRTVESDERKRLKKILTASEVRFRRLFETAQDGILILDADKGRITDANPFLKEMLGYTTEELLGKRLWEIGLFKDIAKSENAFKELLKEGYVRYEDLKLETKDGKPVDVEFISNVYDVDHKKIIQCNIREISERKEAEEVSEQYKKLLEELAKQRTRELADSNRKLLQELTERKRAEKALQEEKNKLESVIDAMDYTLTIQDKDFNIIYQNESSKLASGGDHIGEKCYRVLEGREAVCDGCPVKKAFNDGESHTAERQRLEPSGEITYWENTANPIRDAKGKIVSCLELARDITERKKSEQALADETTRHRILIDQSLDGIVILDENSKVYEANQRFAEMLGYTPEEVRELHTWDWDKNFPPEQLLEMGRTVDEKGLHLETRHHRKDGSAIDVDICINGAMCTEQTLIFCVCRDITARKQAEEALGKAEQEKTAILNSLNEIVIFQDLKHRVMWANKTAAKSVGLSPKQLVGRYCHKVWGGSNKSCPGCPLEKVLETGQPQAGEITSPDGKIWSIRGYPVRDANGDIASLVEMALDITEQKNMQEKLIITDRLASIGELSAGIAHEINNPLTGVIGFSNLLSDRDDLPDDIREDLEVINKEAKRTAEVVTNLLTFAREHKAQRALTDTNKVIQGVLDLRAYEQKGDNIGVKTSLASDLPEINADTFRLQQVFLNIVINAEYFMKEAHNGGTLTITTEKVGDKIRVSFADDGPGIAKKALGHLFDPFFTTKEVGKGTGLGLSICHGIIAEHGGRIYAESELGKGTTFTTELPIGDK